MKAIIAEGRQMQNLLLLATCRLQTRLPHLWQPASSEFAKMHATPYFVCKERCREPRDDILVP